MKRFLTIALLITLAPSYDGLFSMEGKGDGKKGKGNEAREPVIKIFPTPLYHRLSNQIADYCDHEKPTSNDNACAQALMEFLKTGIINQLEDFLIDEQYCAFIVLFLDQKGQFIEKLSFLDGDLTEIPKWVKGCPNLQDLDLGENHALKKLPDWIGHFKHLKVLDLTMLDFSQLPEVIQQLNLEELVLEKTMISELPAWFENFQNLRILNLSCCMFKQIPPGLEYLPKLEEVDVTDNDGIEELPKWLVNCKSLKKINISGCEDIPQDQIDALRVQRPDLEIIME